MTDVRAPHLSPEELVDYFAMELDDARSLMVEEHLADCSDCADLARRVRSVSADFDRWTDEAQQHSRFIALVHSALAATGGRDKYPELRQRIQEWANALADKTRGVFRVVVQTGIPRAIREIESRLEVSPDRVLSPAFAVRTRGRGATRRTAEERATSHLRITVQPGIVSVEATAPTTVSPQSVPLVALVDIKNPVEVRVQEMRLEGKRLVAEFRGLPDGEYAVAFERAIN